MNLGALKKHRTLLIGGAAALGVGVLVAMRRGGSSLGGSSTGGQPLQPAQLDTSASDMGQALDSAQASWASDLREFSGSLQSVLDRLNQLPSTGTGSDHTQRTPRRTGPTNKPRPQPAPSPGGRPWLPRPRTTPVVPPQRRR